jgi:hypothetical protein
MYNTKSSTQMKALVLKYNMGAFEVYDEGTHQLSGHVVILKMSGSEQCYSFRPVNGQPSPPERSISDSLSRFFGNDVVLSIESII